MLAVHGVAQRIGLDEGFLPIPVLVERAAKQDADIEVDVDQVGRHQLAIHHHARRDEHPAPPLGHGLVVVVAHGRVLERAPATQLDAPAPHLLVAGQRFVEEVEQVVVQRHHLLHELHVSHQAREVVGKELDGGHRAHATGIKRGRMHVAPLHQAEHFARVAADHQGLAVELPGKGVERRHDVSDGAITMLGRVRRFPGLGFLPHARVGLAHHLFAEVHADQVVLEDVVVEHVFGRLAQVDDPLGDGRRPHAIRHVLRVHRARGVVVAADAADAAGDEVGIARILALHEDAVAAEDGRRAVALRHAAILEVDLGIDAEAAHDPRDRVPVHLDKLARRRLGTQRSFRCNGDCHDLLHAGKSRAAFCFAKFTGGSPW